MQLEVNIRVDEYREADINQLDRVCIMNLIELVVTYLIQKTNQSVVFFNQSTISLKSPSLASFKVFDVSFWFFTRSIISLVIAFCFSSSAMIHWMDSPWFVRRRFLDLKTSPSSSSSSLLSSSYKDNYNPESTLEQKRSFSKKITII